MKIQRCRGWQYQSELFQQFGKVDAASGFALPMVMIMGLIMLTLASASILASQSNRDSAAQRQSSGASLLTSDSAIARALVQLKQPNNGVLLNRNYDPIDPQTDKNYLGSDGIPQNGDETATAVDEWTGYNPSGQPCFQQLGWAAPSIALTSTIGQNSSYTIRAYRYDKQQQLGTLLIEGNYKGQLSRVTITISVEPILDDFPGLLLIDPSNGTGINGTGVLALRGRQILGRKSNLYYVPDSSADPSLTGNSASGGVTRASYLNALYSSTTQDGGNGDTVGGKIFACSLHPQIPPPAGTSLGVLKTSQTLTGSGGTVPTLYQVDQIDLAGTDVLTVDTTNGPVYINIVSNNTWGIRLRDQAKVLNVRTDGQSPRVGDLRIMARNDSIVELNNATCIQNAFLWFQIDEFRILTSAAGCPGGQNTNFEGVAWMEAILFSKNSASNRNVKYLGSTGQSYDTTITPGATSGIAVPDDVSSLVDLLDSVNWPVKYQYGTIKSWQRVQQ